MKILKNSIIYSIVSILQKAVAFLLLPLYTAYLSTTEYGIISVVISITNLLSIFFVLSLNAALTRFYYDHAADEEYIKELIGTIVLTVLLLSFSLSAILIVTQSIFLSVLVKEISFFPHLFIGMIATVFFPLYLIYQNLLQTKQEGKKFGINAVLYFTMNTALTILFVVGLQMKSTGFLLAITITNFLFFVHALIALGRLMRFKINASILGAALKYSLPIVPHTLSSWVFTMIDRIFLNNFKNQDTTGLYSVGYQFGNLINITTSSVNQAYVPWFFEKMSSQQPDRMDKIIAIVEYLTVLYTLLSVFISLFGKEILSFMVAKDFRDAWEIIPFISFGYVFSGLYYFFVNPLFYYKKYTKLVAAITFTSASANIIFNIALIPTYGMIGSAVASALANFLLSLTAYVFMMIFARIKFKAVRMYLIAIAGFALSYGLTKMAFPPLIYILSKIGMFIVLSLLVFLKYKKVFIMIKKIFLNRTVAV